MPGHATWIVLLLISAFTVTAGVSNTEPKCAKKVPKSKLDITKRHCFVTKQDVKLSCPTVQVIVLKSFQLAVKNESEHCLKRVLDEKDDFCCTGQDIDVIYDGHCLQKMWNVEDNKHYQTFIKSALSKCMNQSRCTLNSEMFYNLQRKIPDIIPEQYSSYFQIVYQCVKAPANPMKFCSSTSKKGKEIHFFGSGTPDSVKNTSCMCSVTSQNGNDISVKAVDIRSTNDVTSTSGLILSGTTPGKNISVGDLPLFGFREILTDKGINISLKTRSKNGGENLKLWLHVSDADGQDVNVTCKESTGDEKGVTTATGQVSPVTQEADFGHWPIVYIAAGSFITIIIIACVFGVIWLCTCRKKKKRYRSAPPMPPDCPQDGYDPPYATVLDHTPQGRSMRVSRSVSSQTLQRSYSKPYPRPYPRSTSMRSLRDRPPMAPPPPPPNAPARKNDNNTQPYSRLSRTPGVSCDVSQLEAFLECKEPVPSVSSHVGSIGGSYIHPHQRSQMDSVQGSQVGSIQGSYMGSVHGSAEPPIYDSPSRFGPRSRLESNESIRSQQRSLQGFESVPRSGATSPQCFGSVFESEASVTESLLWKGETPPVRDFLLDTEEVQSLLLDHKEDENHNEFDSNVEPVMTRM